MGNWAIVSVVLCTYNGEKHIRQQLDSLLSQTYSPIEIIIQDDNSTDTTLEILAEYQKEYKSISVYRNEENIGFNQNFEKALMLAKGEYIAICDQDDIWLENKIERLVNHIKDHWLIFSNSELIDETGKSLNKLLVGSLDLKEADFTAILLRNFVSGHTTLFKREFIAFILPFPKTGYYDWWMGFVALYHHKLIYLDEVLTRYRIHSHSVINKQVDNMAENALKRAVQNSALVQLGHFYNYLKDHRKQQQIISKVVTLFNPESDGQRDFKLALFLYLNYNQFFPFEKYRNVFSYARYKFAKNYVKTQRDIVNSTSDRD